jgi:site-specific recombinase XerD
VDALVKTTTRNHHGTRDSLMIMMAYRRGLRTSELVDLRWSQVNFSEARLYVTRLMGSKPSTHVMNRREP